MADRKDTILAAMQKEDKPLRPGDIASATGLEKTEVSKLLGELKKEGKVYSPKRCFWAPSD